MDIHPVADEGVWDYPLKRAAKSQLTQSWGWGIFQQTLSRRAVRLQVSEGATTFAALQLFEQSLSVGQHYLYAPRGPHILTGGNEDAESITHHILRGVEVEARRSRAVFARLEPHGQDWIVDGSFANSFTKPATNVQPADELHILTTKDESELLAAMQEKTRYNIRLAERRGVRGRLIEDLPYARRVFPLFLKLLNETAKRQGIRTHAGEYYRRMIDILMPRGEVKLYVAEFENEIIVANILGVFGDTVTYLHGASSYSHRSLMAPYLLHWEGIRLAKRLDCARYNLGGVSPTSVSEHPWANITRFKEGFATLEKTGERVHFVPAVDLVTRPFWYRMYATSRSLRRRVRRHTPSSG